MVERRGGDGRDNNWHTNVETKVSFVHSLKHFLEYQAGNFLLWHTSVYFEKILLFFSHHQKQRQFLHDCCGWFSCFWVGFVGKRVMRGKVRDRKEKTEMANGAGTELPGGVSPSGGGNSCWQSYECRRVTREGPGRPAFHKWLLLIWWSGLLLGHLCIMIALWMRENFNNISLTSVQTSDSLDLRRILTVQITLIVHSVFAGMDWPWRRR